MRRETSDSLCACFAFVFSEEEEDGAPLKTEPGGCFLAQSGRGSDSGQITIEMMTETKPWPLTRQRERLAPLRADGDWRGRCKAQAALVHELHPAVSSYETSES